MKLKCDQHKRRVVTGEKSFLHKTGDNSPCESKTATIGTQTFSNTEAASISVSNNVKNGRGPKK